MVIYEVSIDVPNEIIDDYMAWFVPHIKEMLQFKGFQQSEYFKVLRGENKTITTLTVHYLVKTLENLDNYFEHHASKMRQEAINKFGNRLSFRRSILQKQEEIFVK